MKIRKSDFYRGGMKLTKAYREILIKRFSIFGYDISLYKALFSGVFTDPYSIDMSKETGYSWYVIDIVKKIKKNNDSL